jgi:hypothetical protein
MRSILLTVIFGFLLAGCTGTIKTEPLTAGQELSNKLEGIVYYPLARFYELTATTVTKDDKGITTHWYSNGTCVPVIQSRLVVRPDYNHPRLIKYDHGYLENYKFSVTLGADGGLLSAGSESAPDRGQTLSNLAGAALNGAKTGGFAAAAAKSPTKEVPACNDGPVVFDYKTYSPGTAFE